MTMRSSVGRAKARWSMLALLAAVSVGRADILYWDQDGAGSASLGGVGNWTGALQWRQGATNGPLVDWPNGNPNGDTAALTGTGTLTVNAPIFVNTIDFQGLTAAPYTITGTNYITMSGTNPTLSLTGTPTADHVIAAPLTGVNGITISGSQNQASRFIVLANTNAAAPNNWTGTLTIASTGALRMGGGFNEQIPDNVDMDVSGVIDFITASTPGVGAPCNGKVERIHDLFESGAQANFSVGNGATFIMHNLTETNATGSGVSLNGNNATNSTFTTALPAKLIVEGDLSLTGSILKVVTTSNSGSIVGGIANLMGNFSVSGGSTVTMGAASAATVANHAFNFLGPVDNSAHTHEVNVAAGGTLTFTAVNATQTLDITSSNGAATVNKTGAGEWVISSRAAQTTFTGTTDVQQGILTIGASERLANASGLVVSGGTFDMQTFNETVASVKLTGGSISGSGAATLTSTTAFDVRAGNVAARLGGTAGLNKTTGGTATLAGANSYTGPTAVSDGLLIVSGSLAAGTTVTVSGTGAIGGAGIINGPITLAAGGKLSPGNSPGSLASGSQVWQPGGTFAWEISTASTTFGTGKGLLAGYDFLNITGSLDLTGLDAAHPMFVDAIGMDFATLTAGGSISGWDPTKTYAWVLATASGGINGFGADDFVVSNDFGPANPLGSGGFRVAQGGGALGGTANDLLLVFTAVPEPASLGLLAMGMGLMLARRRRQSR